MEVDVKGGMETEFFLLSGFEKTSVQQCLELFKESLNILLELISMEPSFSSKSSVQKRCMMNLTQEFHLLNSLCLGLCLRLIYEVYKFFLEMLTTQNLI